MARKKQYDFFKAIAQLADNTHQAAESFAVLVQNYDPATLIADSEKIHTLEKDSDQVIAELTNELYDAFITPIDREDILVISERIDDILDGINGLTYLFENLVVSEMRPETEIFAQMIATAAKGVHTATEELPKFKVSKTLKSMIDEVNSTESEADRLYSKLKKRLFSEETDLLTIIKWKEIYDKFEEIINASEDAVDIIDGIIIKNS
ncbi:TIGR00153 family protein [Enterococcus asini ATCC 700915]|uniref:TIGR00153 family protein n=1 Tax=Enterococcus asini ATCC 700915 TaxID=1158606 RepID=R2S2U9_9ENTE|nr:DUF47 family protein [Enterococcus asini]EOH87181.1 TIGR00153 family protein [Enterococcus asini ATCC 700915]EOT58413.1 TIGR00153 family protein [Enterococcus asini ATCC 700915]